MDRLFGNLLARVNHLAVEQCRQPDVAINPLPERLVFGCHALRAEQFVHLFQGAPLGLGNEEPHVNRSDDGNAAEEDEGTVGRGRDEGRGGQTDTEVVELGRVRNSVSRREVVLDSLTQLLLPPILTPLARILSGKTSDTTIHAHGPVWKR